MNKKNLFGCAPNKEKGRQNKMKRKMYLGVITLVIMGLLITSAVALPSQKNSMNVNKSEKTLDRSLPLFLGTADSIGTVCNLMLNDGDSEPRNGGIRQLNFHFDRPPSGTPVLRWDNTPPGPPVFVPYSGSSVMSCIAVGNDLQCTFTPALEDQATCQFDFTGISYDNVLWEIASLKGDVNMDRHVDGADRSIVHGLWGSTSACAPDVNEDGNVDGADRSIIHGLWGNSAP